MAGTGLTVYPVNVMNAFEGLIYVVPAGLRLVLQIIILVVAVMAARRYQLKGLWILVAAVFLADLQDMLGMVSTSMYRVGNDNAMADWSWLACLPFVITVLILWGWCVLAFSHKQGSKTDAN